MTTPVHQLLNLAGETALVAGGSKQVRYVSATAMAEAGADVVLIQGDQAIKNKIELLGRRATIYSTESSSQASVTKLVSEILADGHVIHVLVNCGSIESRNPLHSCPQNHRRETPFSHLTSTFQLFREVGKHMLTREPDSRSRRGSIVNISTSPHGTGLERPANAATNGGITQLTKALSNEWAYRGICINAISLHRLTDTLRRDETVKMEWASQAEAGDLQAQDDLKGSLLFLASPASGYVTGTTVTIDGALGDRQE